MDRRTGLIGSGVACALLMGVLAACGGEDDTGADAQDAGGDAEVACDPSAQTGCAANEVCERVEGAEPACFAPVYLRGRVVQSTDRNVGIGGARVLARDIDQAPVSRGGSLSEADGTYALPVPVTRKADGTPVAGSRVFLRASANGFAAFPGGLRVALPIDLAPNKLEDGTYEIRSEQTTVALDALPAGERGTVRGKVLADNPAGTLVVAGSQSDVADADGSYTVFNVEAGAQTVRGYAQGSSLQAANTTVPANGEVSGVDLAKSDVPTGRVEGTLQFVNAGASSTSVVLVVASTFLENIGRGETPRGLRLNDVTGAYAFTDVPPGDYVLLAAFDNDGLVRDPDTSIGGTATQRVTVAGATVSVPSFKITGALAVRSPGAEQAETVQGAPTFVFADDSSEDGYDLLVYDTFGVEQWKTTAPAVNGSADVRVPYAGPALGAGTYQFRAYSFRDKQGGKTFISATEDLRGVFVVP